MFDCLFVCLFLFVVFVVVFVFGLFAVNDVLLTPLYQAERSAVWRGKVVEVHVTTRRVVFPLERDDEISGGVVVANLHVKRVAVVGVWQVVVVHQLRPHVRPVGVDADLVQHAFFRTWKPPQKQQHAMLRNSLFQAWFDPSINSSALSPSTHLPIHAFINPTIHWHARARARKHIYLVTLITGN